MGFLSAGLVVAVMFNFNDNIRTERDCVTCCDLTPTMNDFLECYDNNQAQCRDLQITGGCDIENTHLINGPFILISTCQSSVSTPVNETINPTTTLTVLQNQTLVSGSTLSLGIFFIYSIFITKYV